MLQVQAQRLIAGVPVSRRANRTILPPFSCRLVVYQFEKRRFPYLTVQSNTLPESHVA